MPSRGEFRATTDQLLEILDELRTFEEAKRAVAVGSPAFVDLADKAADQARLAFRWCQMQQQMAHDAAARVARGEQAANVHLLEITPRPIDRILALWREAQIRLEIARPESEEAARAATDIERLREEYQVAHQALRDAGLALERLGREDVLPDRGPGDRS
jgi:hypothetical protein